MIEKEAAAASTQLRFSFSKGFIHESAEEKYCQTGQNDLQAIQLHAKHSLHNASSIKFSSKERTIRQSTVR